MIKRICWSCNRKFLPSGSGSARQKRCKECISKGYVFKILVCECCEEEFEWNPCRVKTGKQRRKYCDYCIETIRLENIEIKRQKEEIKICCIECSEEVFKKARKFCDDCLKTVRVINGQISWLKNKEKFLALPRNRIAFGRAEKFFRG